MRNEAHMNYLRRKTADEAELWAADRIENLEREVASRDAEVAELTGANVLNRNALRLQKEKTDQLREDVKMLRDALDYYANDGTDVSVAQNAIAATEPKE